MGRGETAQEWEVGGRGGGAEERPSNSSWKADDDPNQVAAEAIVREA